MTIDEDTHDKQARAVMVAVAGLPLRFPGFAPEAVLEGAVKGAAVQLIAAGATTLEVAALLDDLAAIFREGGDFSTVLN